MNSPTYLKNSMKIAVLVANGFEEPGFLAAQKMMLEKGARLKIISTNQGLVNAWNGQGWGHNYAVDAPLNTALAADYDALIIPGGQRSVEKLKNTAHSRRFIASFLAANKPLIVMEDAVKLLAYTEQLDGKAVTGPDEARLLCTQQGARWVDESIAIDGAMLTGRLDGQNRAAYFAAMRGLILSSDLDQAA